MKKKRLTKSEAIRLKCLDCSGDSPREVTLCVIRECPLWPFRFGYGMNTQQYRQRMTTAKKRYSNEYKGWEKTVQTQ